MIGEQSIPQYAAGKILGHYRMVEKIGAGGMGEVYRAHDEHLARDVAIKVLPPGTLIDESARKHFRKEALILSQLNHPNIATIYDFDTHQGVDFLVMEYIPGITLSEKLGARPLPEKEIISLGTQLSEGLSAAHDHGVVHRDLKPDNLRLTSEGRLKILDFGLAKLRRPAIEDAATESLSETHAMAGTLPYMAPEQLLDGEIDARTDIHAAGSVLYEMATGKRPFADVQHSALIDAILRRQPRPPAVLNPRLSAELERIIGKCLEKDPGYRYQSAKEIGVDLRRLATPSAVVPSGVAPRARRRWPHKAWLAAGALVTVLLALGLGWFAWKHKAPVSAEVVQRQLTARNGDDPVVNAVISADGKYLAYSDKEGISIEEIENGDTHKITATVGLEILDWYHDGLRLLATDNNHDLWTIFAFSGEKRKLATRVVRAKISPNGSLILLTRELLGRELWTMPSEGGEPQVRLTLGKDDQLVSVAWSPDSKAVADIRSRVDSRSGSLEVRDLQDGKARVLLPDSDLAGGGCNSLYWLPDGRILFGLFRGGLFESDLWALSSASKESDAGKPVRLTNTTGSWVDKLSASADGKRLAVMFTREPVSAFVANFSKNGDKLIQPLRLTNDQSYSSPRAWTPDSESLFYISSRNYTSLFKRRISSDSAELFAGGSAHYWAVAVSPDGKWVLVTRKSDSGGRQLLRLPVSGGPPETILTLAGPGLVRCAAVGSRICLLSEAIGGKLVFSTIDPVRGRLEKLAAIELGENDALWDLSPDGSKIANVGDTGDGVRVVDVQSGQVSVIHPTPPQTSLQYVAWSADGNRLFLAAFPGEKGKLLEMDLAGHTRLLLENPYGWVGVPIPSPDGKRIAYTYGLIESNVTLLEHF